MINSIKSEWYRISHTGEVYIFTGIVAGLMILYNLVLFIFNHIEVNFPYGTVRFSLSSAACSMQLVLLAGGCLAGIVFGGERKHGILKNTLAAGISRKSIFFGKCIISTIAAFCSLIVILVAYIGSAVLLLDGDVWTPCRSLLNGFGAMLLCAIAAVILAVLVYSMVEKETMAIMIWIVIMFVIPSLIRIVGLKLELFQHIANWMPANYLKDEVWVTMSEWDCLWDTPEGFLKCFLSGAIGIVIFLITGVVLCRKQEA